MTLIALLNQEFVTQAVTLIVTRFLPLKPMDLEKWEGDPEEWVLEETKDYEAWEFDIRVRCPRYYMVIVSLNIAYSKICAERVLMTLLDKYQQFVVPMLTNALATELSKSILSTHTYISLTATPPAF